MRTEFLYTFIIIFSCIYLQSFSQNSSVRFGLVKYNGGGDWYANPTALPNLATFCNDKIKSNIEIEPATVELASPLIFNYPILFITGHGNIILSSEEVYNLRQYLESGGFLHIDDNYGLDKYIRREMKKVFPNQDFSEVALSHPVYHQKYEFDKGLPKIHEHDNKPPQGFGLFIDGRLVCFYTYECDLGDGWEDYSVHKDPNDLHEAALKMGANIVSYSFSY
ncbi:MAG: DUF4159 domain-containing protein [Bacteroidales bacterium]